MRKELNIDIEKKYFMQAQKRNIYSGLLLGILFGIFNSSMAQTNEAPLWMEHIVRAEITDTGYTESQKVLDPYSISTVRITMDPSDYIKLINNTNSNEYLLADMTFESPNILLQSIEQVGIRLRGAAARGSRKKSFKISFRAFGHDDREFFSLRKLNLNSDFQDPHLMRAKTCTDLFRLMGVDAARVGYTKLYINDDYRGLFANYEDIDKTFLRTRFGGNDGNLYKCDGASMQNGRGGYQLTTNEEIRDYSDILEFIDVLNNTPDSNFKEEIEKVFDVDEMLMYTACNVLVGAWDDYWVLAKNFYFYHDLLTDQFNYIPHDFDGSLGTYWYPRNMDVADQNVYNWSPNSGRPMVEKLLEVPAYRDRYTHYLMLLCMYAFSLETMEPEIDKTADVIRETLINDPYWNWDPSDFDKAFDQAISRGNVKYGMKEYISLRRTSALEQLEQIGPFIKQLNRLPLLPTETDPVIISQLVVDRENVSHVKLIYKVGNSTEEIEMLDNGSGSDEKANDFVYTAQIPAQANADQVLYYVEATNGIGKTSRYPAANEWASFSINYEPPQIAINELGAQNESTKQDENDEYDDWFELYNPGDELVNLTGMYVSDNLSKPRKWRLGNLSIPAKGFLLLWADNDPEQGANHVGFKLSRDGEELGLFDTDENQNLPIDTLQFGLQIVDISFGRTQDGAEEWIFFDEPTPGRGNRDSTVTHEGLIDITDLEDVVITGQFDHEAWPSGGSPSGEEIEKLIDNDMTTKYLVKAEQSWIYLTTNTFSRATSYTITSANDAPRRDPRSWELQGWDKDAFSWVTIHAVTGQPIWEERFQTKSWPVENAGWYDAYRLNITAINGDTQGLMQMAELQIFGVLATTTGVEEMDVFSSQYHLQNYPNPFNTSTLISFTIPTSSKVKLTIYDLHGRNIESLVDQKMTVGSHKVEWNASRHAAGIYFYRIIIDEFSTTKKLIFHK